MPTIRTSRGDAAKTLALLWRAHDEKAAKPRPRRGPSQRLSLDAVIEASISLADAEGLEALTVRTIADRLSISPMSVYTYVPGKAELLDLMLDSAYLAMPRPTLPGPERWRQAVRQVADLNRALFERHPWAAQISTTRPPLGPGVMAKYEYELAPFDRLGLTDPEMDAALTYVLGFVQAAATSAQASTASIRDSGVDDTEWWDSVAPLLERFVSSGDYPLASRVGTAAGVEQGAAYDPGSAYAFGIERVLDGLEALVDLRSADRERMPGAGAPAPLRVTGRAADAGSGGPSPGRGHRSRPG